MDEGSTVPNQIEILLKGAFLDSISSFNNGQDQQATGSLSTFCYFDFFDFQTQVSPKGIGMRPIFNHSFL